MKKFLIILIFSCNLFALDFLVGLGAGTNSVIIDDKQEGEIVATMRDNISAYPVISVRFNNDRSSGLGFFVELDANIFNMEEQLESGSQDDYNTSMFGISTFIVPSIFYEFEKSSFLDLSYRLGGGVGIGLLFITGDFEVTNSSNPRYGEKVDVTKLGFGTTYGLFFEALNDNHSLVIQSYGPQIEDDRYKYTHQNTEVLYRYIF